MDSGRKTRVIVGALLGLLFVGIVALGSIFRTVVFTVAAVIAVYEMSNMIYKKTEKNIFAAPAYIFAALCFPIASFPAALAAGMSAATAIMLLGALCLMLIAANGHDGVVTIHIGALVGEKEASHHAHDEYGYAHMTQGIDQLAPAVDLGDEVLVAGPLHRLGEEHQQSGHQGEHGQKA